MTELPPACDAERLARNLAALAERDGPLAERLALPVASDHVRAGEDGAVMLQHRRAWRRLNLSGEARRGVVKRVGDVGGALPGLLFGVGLGETVEAALAESGTRTWVAWERDPWLLRLALARLDVTRALRSGRLVLRLGADLVELARALARDDASPATGRGELRVHPLLGALYERELGLVERGAVGEVALLAEGELFVDQLGRALARRGRAPYTLDLERLSREELMVAARTTRASLLVAVNYTHGLAEFCAEAGLRLVCWEVDPATDELRPLESGGDTAHVFTYRRTHVESFRAAGFANVRYQPLAADVLERRPSDAVGEERARYAAPVSFVGASMVGRGRELLRDLRAAAEALGVADVAPRLDAVLSEQRACPQRWLVPQLLERECADLLDALDGCSRRTLAVHALSEVAAAEKRLAHVAALAPLGVQVWGDEGWRTLGAHGVRWRGGAGHRTELGRIYSASDVNLDVGRLYQDDIVTMRVFDVLACGGFCLAQRSPELESLFDVGSELDAYESREELVDKARAWLADPRRRAQVAARGLAAVRERHDLDMRLDAMLQQSLAA